MVNRGAQATPARWARVGTQGCWPHVAFLDTMGGKWDTEWLNKGHLLWLELGAWGHPRSMGRTSHPGKGH